MSKVLAIDAVINHLERKVLLVTDSMTISDSDLLCLKAITLQYANANAALTLGTKIIPYELVKVTNTETLIRPTNDSSFNDKALMMRFVTDAVQQVLDINFKQIMEGTHGPINISPIVELWENYVLTLPDNEVINLKDMVTHLSIDTFSTVVHKPVPNVLQKDIAEDIYQRNMS